MDKQRSEKEPIMATKLNNSQKGQLSDQLAEVYRVASNGTRDFSDVRRALQAIIEGKFPEIPTNPPSGLTRVSQYAHKLNGWNDQFDLGLTAEGIAHVMSALPDHDGLLLPTGIKLTLGRGLQHDWEVGMKILAYELDKLGVRFTEYFDASRLSYFAGSEPEHPDGVELDVALLDLQTFWDPRSGIVPREVRKQLKGQPMPGLEVVWFLALNPQVFLAMDGKTMPYLWAAGLVVDSDSLPYFGRDSDGAFVLDGWDGLQWHDDSVVAFRECKN